MISGNKKKIGWVFTSGIIIYSIIIPFLLPSIYLGIDHTIGSLRFPNGFIKKEFNSTTPWIEFSFFIKNFNRLDLNLELSNTIYVQFYTTTPEMVQQTIFRSHSIFYSITPEESFAQILNYSQDYFDLTALSNFYTSANFSKPCQFLMDVKFYGFYLANLITFNANIVALNISNYELIL